MCSPHRWDAPHVRCSVVSVPASEATPHDERDVLCSILYQRGIYPPESFDRQKKYGLAMMVTSDEGLTKYLTSVLKQMSGTRPTVQAHAVTITPKCC